MKPNEAIELVRTMCGALPEMEETIDGFGHTVFRVSGKSFVRIGETEGGYGLCFKSSKEQQHVLIQHENFFKTPYIGQHGWVSVRSPADEPMLEELLKEAYLLAAPKRLVQLWLAGKNKPE